MSSGSDHIRRILIAVVVALITPCTASAQDATLEAGSSDTSFRHALDLGAGVGLGDHGAGQIGYRLLVGERLRFGVDFRWARYTSAVLTHRSEDDGNRFLLRTPLSYQIKSFRRLRIDLVVAPGVRRLDSESGAATTAVTLAAGAFIHWRLLSAFSLRGGVSVPVALDVEPTVEFSRFGFSGHLGMSVRFADWCWGYADGIVSVIDGYGGDAERLGIEGQFGLRFYFDATGPDHDVLTPLASTL